MLNTKLDGVVVRTPDITKLSDGEQRTFFETFIRQSLSFAKLTASSNIIVIKSIN